MTKRHELLAILLTLIALGVVAGVCLLAKYL